MYPSVKEAKKVKHLMDCSQTYEQWLAYCQEYEKVTGLAEWRLDPISPLYDYEMILSRLNHLKQAAKSMNFQNIVTAIRSGLVRNLGGSNNPKLFSQSYTGSKFLIEDYENQVIKTLDLVNTGNFSGNSEKDKLEFFGDTIQFYGKTALILEGGISFGGVHLGVVKALHSQGLLPDIICGSSMGSLIAAYICVHSNDSLSNILNENSLDLRDFEKVGSFGSFRRKLVRFLKHGFLLDVHVLEDFIRNNIGDITFEEAYILSGRVLNIKIGSLRRQEAPMLLNYLTSPNVLVWSAAVCSCANPGLYGPVSLLCKNRDGKIVTWGPARTQNPELLYQAIDEEDLSFVRLTELFNVNNFIVSHVNPLETPFLSTKFTHSNRGFFGTILKLIVDEVRHRLYQLKHLNLLPNFMRKYEVLLRGVLQGDVSIIPAYNWRDYFMLFSNPTRDSLRQDILKGEQATWPELAYIKSLCRIELTLGNCLKELKDASSNSNHAFDMLDAISNLSQKRTRSFH